MLDAALIALGITPVLFGWLVDQGNPEWVFYSIAIFMGFGIISIMGSQRASSRVAIKNDGGDS